MVRYRWELHPEIAQYASAPVIFCIWHNRLSLALNMHTQYLAATGQQRTLAAIVSASRDGALFARILEHCGVQPVRGSSSRRGPQALLELTTLAERGHDLAITPDGPRGPRYIVQPGVIALSQVTGRPIIPSGCDIKWKRCLRSWDRFQIPLPLTRVNARFGQPLLVPREATESDRETLRLELQNRLLSLNPD